MTTVLDSLKIDICENPIYDPEWDTWDFPCKLVVSNELAMTETGHQWALMMKACHKNHHHAGHTPPPNEPWSIVAGTIEGAPLYVRCQGCIE